MSLPRPNWPMPMADHVRYKIRHWHNAYEQGVPYKPRKLPHPQYGDDQPIVVVPAYKHIIEFRLNEIQWLEDVLAYATQELDANDPKSVVYQTIKKARIKHETAQDNKQAPVASPFAQEYLFDKTHVFWMLTILGQHKIGRLQIETNKKKAAEEIVRGDW